MVGIRTHVRAQITWIAAMDLVCLVLGSVIGVLLRFGHEEVSRYVFQHMEGWLLLYGSIILANYLAGAYRLQYTFSRFNLIVTWLFSLFFAVLLLSITSYAWFMTLLGRGVLFLSLAGYSVLSLFLKLMVYRTLFRSQVLTCRTVIVGSGPRSGELRAMLENEYVLPAHKVISFINIVNGPGHDALDESLLDGVAVVNSKVLALENVVRSLGASLIVIGLDDLEEARELYPHLKRLRFDGIEVLMPLQVAEIYCGKTPLDMVNEETLMQASLESSLPIMRRLKRMADIVVSLAACVLLLPLGLLIALGVKLSDPHGPVFYVQDRVGQFGRIFRIIKFRSMVDGAEDETGPVWCEEEDRRITWFGRILRRSRMDELPQFFNILKGDMSLVGPRPERPELVEKLTLEVPYFAERENLLPGLTGWAQIRHHYGNSVEDARQKLEFDLYYLKHLSLSLDLQILLSTLRIVVLGKERKL